MPEQRASANGEILPGPIFDVPTQTDTYDKALKILALARTGVAASDSTMNIDLTMRGYGELLEVIGQLASDILDMQPGYEPPEKGEMQ
ncbi:hypothetical protein [Ruegeria arenilitoris]|uniref:hypothetical protein n=1 Tax=Ruegeria arenilitoris TaxID=1173585 RepID=UPI00147A8AD9|nr:hypothetical protein [Ruegeria arenilitoris]